MYAGMISYEMHKQLKRTETMALKYQQHQEALSAQLQGKHSDSVVIERLVRLRAGDGVERESERHAGLHRENRDFVVVVLTLKWLQLLTLT